MTASDLFDIAGKTALVTGGSRGIGLMIAEGFVDAGVKVYISSRKAEVWQQVAAELSKKGTCIAIPADLSTEAECRAPGGRDGVARSTSSTSWSTTPGPPGARRWPTSTRPPSNACSPSTSRASST